MHTTIARTLTALGLGASLSCGAASEGSGQHEDYAAGIAAICQAELRSGAISAFPFSAKGEAVEAYLARELTHPEAHDFYYEELMTQPPHLQAAALRREADALDISPCPYAGYLDILDDMPRYASSFEDCTRACRQRNAGQLDELEAACASGCGGNL